MGSFHLIFIIVLLLTGYVIALPLCKNRPVLLRSAMLSVYIFLMGCVTYFWWGFGSVVMGAVGAASVMIFNIWFVYGITNTMLVAALEKAAAATRTPVECTTGKCIINNDVSMKMLGVRKLRIISFGTQIPTKKVLLLKDVLRKFIQNYHL